MHGIMRAWAKKNTQRKADFDFTVKVARQKLSKYLAEVTPINGQLLMSAHILDLFRKLASFWKWDKGMEMNSGDQTSYTT
jgi:hypothetical protein